MAIIKVTTYPRKKTEIEIDKPFDKITIDEVQEMVNIIYGRYTSYNVIMFMEKIIKKSIDI